MQELRIFISHKPFPGKKSKEENHGIKETVVNKDINQSYNQV